MSVVIYHNPRCSKSRRALELIEQAGHEPLVIEYLKTPPDQAALAKLVEQLGVRPIDIMRSGDDAFQQHKEALGKISKAEQIAWLAEHPKVLQRPIVVRGERARIGRPPESVLEILS